MQASNGQRIQIAFPRARFSLQNVAENPGNAFISGKPRLVKYYSIWPDTFFMVFADG